MDGSSVGYSGRSGPGLNHVEKKEALNKWLGVLFACVAFSAQANTEIYHADQDPEEVEKQAQQDAQTIRKIEKSAGGVTKDTRLRREHVKKLWERAKRIRAEKGLDENPEPNPLGGLEEVDPEPPPKLPNAPVPPEIKNRIGPPVVI